MTKAQKVLLGFEVGIGNPVEIPITHMCVTGQTQQAGKTTTLEALIERSGRRALTFITKRGEGSFREGHRLDPYFRERADWVFVSGLIDATLVEKNKFLRPWLMKVCRGTKTLREVYDNVRASKAGAKRGFDESVYTEIEGYLELVIPQLETIAFAPRIVLAAGVNVMDISGLSSEVQALVIRSAIEWINEHEDDVITVIPEAWEFLPEGRGSPVKREAETLIRKGAGLKNFVWLDSQDLAGVWKLAVRACAVMLLGVQREANEIKRTLANIPAGVSKPKADALATLELGQFYACWGKHTVKTYVQPTWMNRAQAEQVATGALSVDIASRLSPGGPHSGKHKQEGQVNAAEAKAIRDENTALHNEVVELRRTNKDLKLRIDALEHRSQQRPDDQTARGNSRQGVARDADDVDAPRRHGVRRDANPSSPASPRAFTPEETFENEAFYQAIKARLIEELPSDPRVMEIVVSRPELRVKVQRHVLEVDGDTLRGRMGQLIAEGFFDRGQSAPAAQKELGRRGNDPGPANAYKELDTLAAMGFVTIEQGKDDRGRPRKEYKAVDGMKVNIVDSAA